MYPANPLRPLAAVPFALLLVAVGACLAPGPTSDAACGTQGSSCTLAADSCCAGFVCFGETCLAAGSSVNEYETGSTGGSGTGATTSEAGGTGSSSGGSTTPAGTSSSSSVGGTSGGTYGGCSAGASCEGSLCTLANPGDASNCAEGFDCADWSPYAQGFGVCRVGCDSSCPNGESCSADQGGSPSQSCQCTAVNAPGEAGDSCNPFGLVCHPNFHVCMEATTSDSCPSGLFYSSLWQLCVTS